MKKYLMLLGLIAGVSLAIVSCGRMNDIHEKYRNETIYSGKVSNVRGYAGIEKVYLAWDNPIDYKSKAILITYYAYEDSVEYKYFPAEEAFSNGRLVIDTAIIDGLKHDAAYTFNVYTLDADSNKSITVSTPTPITPMTRSTAEALAGPTVSYVEGNYESWPNQAPTESRVVFVIERSNVTETFISPTSSIGNVTFKIEDLNNNWTDWAGGVGYKLKDASGRVITSGLELKLPTDSVYVMYAGEARERRTLMKVDYYCFDSKEDLLDGETYTVEYSVVGYPKAGSSVLFDTCTVKGSDIINMQLSGKKD